MDDRERIGRRILELRKEHGMTQEELSKKSGVGRAHIAKIESGKFSAGIDTIQKIANVFGKDIDLV